MPDPSSLCVRDGGSCVVSVSVEEEEVEEVVDVVVRRQVHGAL